MKSASLSPTRLGTAGAGPIAPVAPGRKRVRKGERAQGLVEFALVLPLFLVLMLATVDFGWALRQYLVMTNSAREGARVGAVGDDTTKITDQVVNTSAGVLTSGDVSVSGAQGSPGDPVTVAVKKDYNYITPLGSMLSALSGGSLPSPLPMSTSATMRLE